MLILALLIIALQCIVFFQALSGRALPIRKDRTGCTVREVDSPFVEGCFKPVVLSTTGAPSPGGEAPSPARVFQKIESEVRTYDV